MIDLSLLEEGDPEPHARPVDVCREAEYVVDRLFMRAAEKGLTLRYQADAPHLWAYLDRQCLVRLLHRLVDSALTRIRRGRVTVRVLERSECIDLQVEDTGSGIGDPFLLQLIEPGRSQDTDPAHTYEGDDPELALTKRLVDRLGGTIHVDARNDEGTTCTVSFPQAHMGFAPSEPAGRRSAGLAYGRSARAHVLIVDPSPFTQSYVGLLLGRWCRWTVARDRRTACGLMRKHPFDLVLVNIDYQDACGLETMERLRTTVPRRPVSVIALTASPTEGERRVIIDAGFDGYIGLPFGGVKKGNGE